VASSWRTSTVQMQSVVVEACWHPTVGHTGGDLSAPESVRQQIMPTPFPEINAIVPPPDQPS